MSETTIVGVLQNTWARNPVRVRALLDRHTPTDQRKLRTYMLMQSRTGQRLKSVFGDLLDRMHWTEACSEIGNRASSCPPIDVEFLSRELAALRPDVTLVFGCVARQAFGRLGFPGEHFYGPHPTARGPGVQDSLIRLRGELLDWLDGPVVVNAT